MFKKALTISTILSTLGLIINFVSYKLIGELLLAIRFSGGEIETQRGFGLILNEYYPLEDNLNQLVQNLDRIMFDPISFVISFLAFFVLSFLVLLLTKKD